MGPEEQFTRKLGDTGFPFMKHVAPGTRNVNYILNSGPNASYLLIGKKGAEAAYGERVFGYDYRKTDSAFMMGLGLGKDLVQKTS